MQLYILNSAYEFVGFIDEADSILWNKKFNDVGYNEIYLPCSDEMLSTLKKGNYVYRYDDDMFCKIETREITTDAEQGDYIIATANDVVKMLAGRYPLKRFTHKGTVATYIFRLIDENIINPTDATRKIANFVFDKSNFDELTETIETTTTEEDILQIVMTTCKAYNYGFRLSYDIERGQLVFRLKRGKNKATTASGEYVEFSPDFANILSSHYKEDESNHKNIAVILYTNDNGKNVYTYAYDGEEPQGEARRELFINATGISREVTATELLEMYPTARTPDTTTGMKTTYYIDVNGAKIDVANVELSQGEGETMTEKITLTDYAYIPLLQREGKNALAERTRTQEFSGTIDIIDTYEYKTDYDLGDVVKIINEYGIEAEARITEVMESEDNDNGYVIEPKYEYQN